jgi:hypothetical protein
MRRILPFSAMKKGDVLKHEEKSNNKKTGSSVSTGEKTN